MYVCMYVFLTLPFTGLRAPFPLQYLHFHLTTIPYANLILNASYSYFINYILSRDLPGLPFPLTNTFQAFPNHATLLLLVFLGFSFGFLLPLSLSLPFSLPDSSSIFPLFTTIKKSISLSPPHSFPPPHPVYTSPARAPTIHFHTHILYHFHFFIHPISTLTHAFSHSKS